MQVGQSSFNYIVGDKLVWVFDGKVSDESVMPVAGDTENLK